MCGLDLDRLITEAFPEVGGGWQTTGARDANMYPEGSATRLVPEGATRGGTQEEVQGVIRNAPQYVPKCNSAPAGEYEYTEPQPDDKNVPWCSPYCSRRPTAS
jgi:hypothetical protein